MQGKNDAPATKPGSFPVTRTGNPQTLVWDTVGGAMQSPRPAKVEHYSAEKGDLGMPAPPALPDPSPFGKVRG